MNILVASATSNEIAPLLELLAFDIEKPGLYKPDPTPFSGISILVSGVTMIPATAYLSGILAQEPIDFVINAGLAGRYHDGIALAEAVVVKDEVLCELGAKDEDKFLPMKSLGLDTFCLELDEGCIIRQSVPQDLDAISNLQKVRAVTVNTINGNPDDIQRIVQMYAPDVESMEGAGFMFAANKAGVDFIELRCISNNVGPRDKGEWCPEKAIEQLNQKLIEVINELSSLS